MQRLNQVFSYLLIGAGAFLLYQGARIYVEARTGQTEARHEFAQRYASTAPEPRSDADSDTVQPQLAIHHGDVIAKLDIPRLGTELYVVEGDGDQDLRIGPGHMPGTAMPGADGNCVIAGHRDTHFRVLKDLKKGDDIVLETGNRRFVYRVEALHIVRSTNSSSLQPTPDAELHLITCYPFYYVGAAPKRFVVEAELESTS